MGRIKHVSPLNADRRKIALNSEDMVLSKISEYAFKILYFVEFNKRLEQIEFLIHTQDISSRILNIKQEIKLTMKCFVIIT